MGIDEWEEGYYENLKEGLEFEVEGLFLDVLKKKPQPDEKALLAEFLDLIAPNDKDDVSHYNIVLRLANYATDAPKSKDDKRTMHAYRFMGAFYSMIYATLKPEHRKHILHQATDSLRIAYPQFKKLEQDQLQEKVEQYEQIVTHWYERNYPKKFNNRMRNAKVKRRLYSLMKIINQDAENKDFTGMQGHLELLNRAIHKYIK